MLNISFPSGVKALLVITGWGLSLGSLTVGTIFQGYLLPNSVGGLLPEVYGASPYGLWIFYLGCVAISALAALIISDMGRAILSFFPSIGLTALITFLVLALPDLTGILQPPGILQESAILITFSALFPFAFLANLVGTVLGSALGEQLL